MNSRAVFLTRDGIFNHHVLRAGVQTSPRHWDEVKEYSQLEQIRELRQSGFQIVFILNQPDLDKKTNNPLFIRTLNETYRRRFEINAVYVCPAEAHDDPFKKPNPGMFLEAAKELKIDLSKSFHLGDNATEKFAAERAGCTFLLWDRPYNQDLVTKHRVNTMSEVVNLILNETPSVLS